MNTRHANPGPAAGFVRYREPLIFVALVLFFLISFPGNRSEADDGFHYAYLVKTQSWAHLLQPRYLLFLPLCKALYLLTGLDPYLLMCVVSSLCSAGTLLLCYRFLSRVMQLPNAAALWGCAFLLFSYGYWRYAVEAEVYSISNLLCIAVLYIILSGRSVVLAGALAGLAVLIYKPNAMPLFFVFPFAFLIKRRWLPFFVYPAIGGVVVLAGYFLAYRYIGSSSTFVQFLAEGASRSYGSVFVTIFVVLSNIVATGFLYGVDSVEHFIRAKFPANLIVEEVYAANANGFRNYIAIITLVLLAVSMIVLLVMAIRRFSRRNLKGEQGILLAWIIVYAGVLLYLDPNSPEPWTMLMVPLMLLLTALLIAPLFENLRTRRFAWIVVAILFVHNFAGGYGVIATKKSDYIAQRTGWLKQHAQKGDLILSLGSRSTLAYIVYYTPATICSPEQAFDRCIELARETIAAGHKVYLMDDMVNREAAVKFRDGEAFAKVEEFVKQHAQDLVPVNPDDQRYGRVYELRGSIRLQGESQRIDRIDSLLTRMTESDQFSGAVLVADSSRILLSKGYGYADRENRIKNTPDTRFNLSSGSKVFTGAAITLLAQQGKLKITDTVGKYIKGLPKGNEITIYQLLTHSAGVDDFYKAKGFSYKHVKNCTDMMPFMRSLPLVYNPGDSCIYSTGDCIILGAVIEKITGMSFQNYIKTAIIDPLGLKNTNFTPYWQLDESQRQYAIGYRKDAQGGYKRNAYDYDNGSIPLSAGGAWSSVTDLYHFDKAVFTGKIVNQEYLEQMTTPYTPQWENAHFGYIWIITGKKGYSSIGHAGTSSGWHAMNDYYPRQKYTVIILTNMGAVDVYDLSDRIEKILF